MISLLSNPFVLLAITFGIFFGAQKLQQRFKSILLNPVMITIIVVIAMLKITKISYESYAEGGKYIEFWLKPAVVALGYPLYLQLERIKKQLLPILLSQLVGSIIGIFSVIGIAKILGASREVIVSMAPKSVTTPIAMEISKTLDGIPSLTAAIVVIVGLFGGVIGYAFLKLIGIQSPIAQSISIGTAAHALGTSSAMSISGKHGAFASLGLILNGIFTALFAPSIVALLEPWISG